MPAPLLKPSKLARQIRQRDTRMVKAKARTAKERAAAKAWTVRRKEAYDRDRGCSRYSVTPLYLYHPDVEQVAQINHIRFRSAQGSDDLSNLVTLTPEEHEMVHARHPKYVLDITGDANVCVTFTVKLLETGQVVHILESPNPSAGSAT